MKILSWNVNRHDGDLEHESNEIRKEHILTHNADVIILTNTHIKFHLGDPYKRIASTEMPLRHDGMDYKVGENRVSIYTKYPFKNKYESDETHGNRVTSFVEELKTKPGFSFSFVQSAEL